MAVGSYALGSSMLGGGDPYSHDTVFQLTWPQPDNAQFAGVGGATLGSSMLGGFDLRQSDPKLRDIDMQIDDAQIGQYAPGVQLASVLGIQISGDVVLYPALAGEVIVY